MLVATIFADDGGSYKPEDWTYGNIYVKEPNDKIALERELLIVEQTDGFVTALFDFVNTTRGSVTVPCAFPVVVKTQVSVQKDGTISASIPIRNGYRANEAVLAVAFGKDNFEGLSKDELLSLDKKLRTISAESYITELSESSFSNSILNPCKIEQDGKEVAIQTVGIETSIEKNEEATEYIFEYNWHNSKEIYDLTLVLHFYHELHFSPSARSKLSVSYKINSEKKDYKGTSYELTYDISTGGTWKGAMKSFLVFTDSQMTAKGSQTGFETTSLGTLSTDGVGFTLYAAENYKPQKEEELFFRAITSYDEGLMQIGEREGGQIFVKDVRSSSSYKGTYKIAGHGIYGSDQNADKNLRVSTYDAETSFDGIPFNGWVEGAKGDGIGEWIEFTLTKAALGPFASNGLARFAGSIYDDYGHNWGNDADDFTLLVKADYVGSTWEANNRIRSMTLTSSALKKVVTLDMADIFPASRSYYSYDWIALNAVKNPRLLSKGTYRMTIQSVYNGNKYDDTALGEVWFIPLSPIAEKIISADTDSFYIAPINDLIKAYASHYVEILENHQQEEESRAWK
ncbi:hypothetical protein [Treponema sp.]|uniref:hypothetical protein n=1 Tax=Treponema sp. TaxID=166 RepID=UPI0025D0909C|nr:hypothetical protein [Treponema sp.]